MFAGYRSFRRPLSLVARSSVVDDQWYVLNSVMLTYLLYTLRTYLCYLPYLIGRLCKFRLSTTAEETRNDSTVRHSDIPRLRTTVQRTGNGEGRLARH